MIFKNKHLLNF